MRRIRFILGCLVITPVIIIVLLQMLCETYIALIEKYGEKPSKFFLKLHNKVVCKEDRI